MKGREDMPARVMEERVRDAFSVAAETVTARDLPGLPTPAGGSRAARGRRGWTPRARIHALVPVAAAVCVAVIAVTATLVVPKLLAGPPGMNLSTGHLISVTTTQPPVLDGAQTSAAW